MDVEIVDLPAQRVGVLRGDLAHAMETWHQFSAVVPAEALARPGVARCAILPSEVIRGEVRGRPDQVRYDAAALVPDGVPLPLGLIEDRIPAGRYARAVYEGPFEGLAGAWMRFTTEWLPTSGQRVGPGVCFEVYREESALSIGSATRTELHIPLA